MKHLATGFLLISLTTVSSLSAASSLCNGFQTDLFGDKVCVFNSAQSPGSIQDVVTNVHDYEKENQFGSQGYALLFQPGTYAGISVPVGYYTQVMGLGLTPNDTSINEVISADLHGNTSLDDFWRSAENFSTPSAMVWAVSQASPLRNLHIGGVLVLSLGGDHYASGGFLANTQVDQGITSKGQQQWLTRNTSMGAWYDPGVWNMVFVGDKGGLPKQDYPNTIVEQTPRIQEKPYLVYDGKQYEIIVPSFKKTNSSGPDWRQDGNVVILQNRFVIAKPDMSSDQINDALHAVPGKDPIALIFTPGQYDHLTSTIKIDREDTVVMGLGVPVLTAKAPHHAPIMITSKDGIKISGLIFEAGSTESSANNETSLLQIGENYGSGLETSPSLLADVYCRVGGRVPGAANSCITINDNYVIADNLWLWRADHGAGAGLHGDPANNGLIVNGDHVTIYGLAVEHFEQNQVEWFGQEGSVYFYQSELPYVVDPGAIVPASFKVEDGVNRFAGYGFGVYDYFTSGGDPYSLSAIEAPAHPGISFTHMVTVALGGGKHITNMVWATPFGVGFPGIPVSVTPLTKTLGYWDGNSKPANIINKLKWWITTQKTRLIHPLFQNIIRKCRVGKGRFLTVPTFYLSDRLFFA